LWPISRRNLPSGPNSRSSAAAAACRAGGIAARQDEDVALGIERDTADFAEIHIVRQLERIRHGLEIEDGRRLLLGKGRRPGKQPRESKSDER
jgi:hypothetical protein